MRKSYIKVDSSEHGTESCFHLCRMVELDHVWKTVYSGDKRFIQT